MVTSAQCPSLASLLTNGQPENRGQVTQRFHYHGWIETPDGRNFQPNSIDVSFIKDRRTPYMAKPRYKRRWFARLMGIFA